MLICILLPARSPSKVITKSLLHRSRFLTSLPRRSISFPPRCAFLRFRSPCFRFPFRVCALRPRSSQNPLFACALSVRGHHKISSPPLTLPHFPPPSFYPLSSTVRVSPFPLTMFPFPFILRALRPRSSQNHFSAAHASSLPSPVVLAFFPRQRRFSLTYAVRMRKTAASHMHDGICASAVFRVLRAQNARSSAHSPKFVAQGLILHHLFLDTAMPFAISYCKSAGTECGKLTETVLLWRKNFNRRTATFAAITNIVRSATRRRSSPAPTRTCV